MHSIFLLTSLNIQGDYEAMVLTSLGYIDVAQPIAWKTAAANLERFLI